MKLGIHVKTERHLEHIAGIVNAAVSKGHEVMIFTMAEGEKLLENPKYSELCRNPNVKMSYCDHDATHMGINKSLVPSEVTCGSQYNNAMIVSEADRMLVF